MKISGVYRRIFPVLILLPMLICLAFPSVVPASSAESGGGGVTVIPDASIIIQIINFLFAVWVLNVLLYKPIRRILAQRKAKVDGLALAIESSNRDVREKDDAFTLGIKEARARGMKAKGDLLQQAADEEKSIIAEINRKAQAELTQIKEQVQKEAEVARESLRKQIDNFADQISKKILGGAVS